MRMLRSTWILAAAMLLAGAGCARGEDWPREQDWPQWRGANRDGKVAGFVAPKYWPKTLTEQWRVEVGDGDATPALVAGKVYVFARQDEEEVTLCLNAADGKQLWRDHYATTRPSGAAASHPGPRSSPAVADGKVVTLGVGGVLSCLDAASGKVLWRYEAYKSWPKVFMAGSPLIVDGIVIAHLGTEGSGAVVALDLATGKVKWKCEGEGPSCSSPMVMTVAGVKYVVVLGEKTAMGIVLADGEMVWQFFCPPGGANFAAATPVVDNDTVMFAIPGRGIRTLKIEPDADSVTPKDQWICRQALVQFCTPVLKDGFLYGLTDRGTFYCINAANGTMTWNNSVIRGGGFAAMLDAGPVILALTNISELIAFAPDGTKYNEVARIKVATTQSFAHPVVAGRHILIKSDKSLAMFTLEEGSPPPATATAPVTRPVSRPAMPPVTRPVVRPPRPVTFPTLPAPTSRPVRLPPNRPMPPPISRPVSRPVSGPLSQPPTRPASRP